MAKPPGPDEEPTLRDDDGTPTELIASARGTQADHGWLTSERRFTAPSAFDVGQTQVIDAVRFTSSGPVVPRVIPGLGTPRPRRRSWGWAVAIALVILAVAIVGTALLTRHAPAQSLRNGQLAALSMA